jgi:hypothetical protein
MVAISKDYLEITATRSAIFSELGGILNGWKAWMQYWLDDGCQYSVPQKIECHISPHDKHFADVNVLGADFLVKNGLTLKVNYSSDIGSLMVEENE